VALFAGMTSSHPTDGDVFQAYVDLAIRIGDRHRNRRRMYI
jgi:hypothetical protein